ncbi:MAG: hypothetical protein ACRD82_02235, partial [Blastocatellia bacterium]
SKGKYQKSKVKNGEQQHAQSNSFYFRPGKAEKQHSLLLPFAFCLLPFDFPGGLFQQSPA